MPASSISAFTPFAGCTQNDICKNWGGLSDAHRRAVDDKQRQIWDYYRQLFEYRLHPDPELREPLRQKFDQIFKDKTCYPSLNRLLQRLYKNKSELLRALDYPHTPLHNNLCENDARVQVMRRKISAGTRSDAGRDARGRWSRTAENLPKTEHQLLALSGKSVSKCRTHPTYRT